MAVTFQPPNNLKFLDCSDSCRLQTGPATKTRLQLQPCRLSTGPTTKNSSFQIAVLAPSPSIWACHHKISSQIAAVVSLVAFEQSLRPKNLEFRDCSYSSVTFQQGLPLKSFKLQDCSCSSENFRKLWRFLLSTKLQTFFGWQLLGYVPGGAPFSQLNIGVTDAMAIIKS